MRRNHHFNRDCHNLIMLCIEKIVILILLYETFLAHFIYRLAFAYCGCICKLFMLKYTFKLYFHHSIVIVVCIKLVTFFIYFVWWVWLTLLLWLGCSYSRDLNGRLFYNLLCSCLSLLDFLFFIFAWFPFVHPTFSQLAS